MNVVVRLINLPFVSSTYDMVSSTYVTTKDNHPYLKSVCDIAEKSVKSITSVAITSAMPILQKLERQIALANNIACVGLDKIEERLPILYQPPEKVVANASEAVVGARDAVIHSITGVVDKTKGAVQDSVEMTKAVVNGGINTVLGSNVVKIMSDRVDSALTRSECLLEQFLPPTDEELAKEATKMEGFEISQNKPGYYVRLGSLSTKARRRAYQQALTRMKDAKCRSQEAIAQLHNTVDLIEYARKNMNNANQKIHDAQENIYTKWVEWTKGEDAGGATEGAEQIESRTLTIARSLTNHLQRTCLSLVSSVQGLPQTLQNKAQSISGMAADIYQNFCSASSFRDMSDSLLTATKDKITKIKDNMDDVMDYFINNTPLNWLVPDFSINDLGAETDDNPDMIEEEMQDFSQVNSRAINRE
ncbi:perilipin-2-like isoform 2-T2 [Anomaloglossus baeobatrachus]|uniref:perilipin-2-like isoform X2 n=1 Tax=Anomaloglossus baeobatrachus TaxID=238106 RepID=UPI003F4FE2C5